MKDELIKHGDWKVHPLFKDLQFKSPYQPFYKITQYDNTGADSLKTINEHDFYEQYVSQSIPAIFRNDLKQWEVMKNIKK